MRLFEISSGDEAPPKVVSNRKSRRELLSTSEASWATTKSGGMWKAKGQEKDEHAFDKRLAVAQELHVGRFIVEIDSDGAVVPCPCGGLGHMSPPGHQVTSADETRWG